MAISATQLEQMSDKVITAAQPYVAWLQNFCTDLSLEDSGQYAGVGVHVLQAVATDFDTDNNYFAAAGSDDVITVPLSNHKKASFALTDVQISKGDYSAAIAKYGPVNGRALGKAISDAAVSAINGATPLTSINMGTAGNAVDTLTLADFTKIVGSMKKFTVGNKTYSYDPAECVLCLSAEAYAKLTSLLPANIVGDGEAIRTGAIGAFLGLKDVVCGGFEKTYDTTGKFVGFIVPMGAVAIAARAVATGVVGNNLLAASTFADPNTGLPFGERIVRDEGNGKTIWTVEALYGAEMTYDGTTCPKAPRHVMVGIAKAG